jgi:exoribonuclease R
MSNRNRALEGDVVALEILPRSEWKLMETDMEEAGLAGKSRDDLPDEFLQVTAKVVAIVESVPNRLYVGTVRAGTKKLDFVVAATNLFFVLLLLLFSSWR